LSESEDKIQRSVFIKSYGEERRRGRIRKKERKKEREESRKGKE
jgi:hypothetical protein